MALTEHEIGLVKGMLSRGDRQHNIAAYFSINSGRIAEISTGQRGHEVRAIHEGLPPEGSPIEHARNALEQAEIWIARAKENLE